MRTCSLHVFAVDARWRFRDTLVTFVAHHVLHVTASRPHTQHPLFHVIRSKKNEVTTEGDKNSITYIRALIFAPTRRGGKYNDRVFVVF